MRSNLNRMNSRQRTNSLTCRSKKLQGGNMTKKSSTKSSQRNNPKREAKSSQPVVKGSRKEAKGTD